jgi:hypothetical protein
MDFLVIFKGLKRTDMQGGNIFPGQPEILNG